MIFKPALDTDEIVQDTRQHAFPVGIAIKYSMQIAVWIQNLAFWTENNLSLNKNIHDGLCWSYATLESLGDTFPYMSKSQRETMINNSINEGLVIKGNYNQTKYDRTVWYALTPKAYAYFPHFLEEKYMKRLHSSISEKSEMDFPKFRNLFPKNRTPIPDTIPDTKPYKNIIGPSGEVPKNDYTKFDEQEEQKEKSDYFLPPEENNNNDMQVVEERGDSLKSDYFEKQINNKTVSKSSSHKIKKSPKNSENSEKNELFSQFYSQYPIKKKRQEAFKMWCRLNPTEEMALKLIDDVKNRMLNDSEWREGFILHPATYLNPVNRRWEDDVVDKDKIKHQAEIEKKKVREEESQKRMKAIEEGSRRTVERELLEQKHKQQEIEDSKRLRGVVSKASENERQKLRTLIGAKMPGSACKI